MTDLEKKLNVIVDCLPVSPFKDKVRETHAEALSEIDRLRTGVNQCYRMLLSEPDTQGALFKAENILRDLMAPNA